MLKEKKSIQLPRRVKIPAEEGVREVDTSIIDEVPIEEELFRSYFLENTIIIGIDPATQQKRGGSVEVTFDISSLPDSLTSANLKITTFRTHGGLHIPPKEATQPPDDDYKRGNLYINGQLVDNIDLVKEMPHGTDFGFNRLDSYPIVNWIRESQRGNGLLRVKLEVDPDVLWDVDEISIEKIVYESEELKQWVWMVTGALLSALASPFVTILINRLINMLADC